MRALLILLVLLPVQLRANTIATGAITPDTLVGTWEAVMPQDHSGAAIGVYRLDIRRDTDSYLVASYTTSDSPSLVARLVSSEVVDGHVKLRFAVVQPKESDPELIIEGSGGADQEGGRLDAKFSTLYGEVTFRKGAWTRVLESASRKADEFMQKLRNQPRT